MRGHFQVQQPLTSAQVHVVSGMNQPARVVVQQQQQQQQPEYVLQRPMAAPMSGNAMPVRVMQPEEEGGQRYVMVPAYQERMGQEEEQEDACATGKRQSPISIEYNIVPKAMEVLGWEVTGGYQGQLRITNVEAMGADATILELVRGEAVSACCSSPRCLRVCVPACSDASLHMHGGVCF